MRGEPLREEAREKVQTNIQKFRTVLHQKRQKEAFVSSTQMEEYSPTRPSYPSYPTSPKYSPSAPDCGKCLFKCCGDCQNVKKCSCHHNPVSVSDNEYSSGSDVSEDEKTTSSVPTPVAFSGEFESCSSQTGLTPIQQWEQQLKVQRQGFLEEEQQKQATNVTTV